MYPNANSHLFICLYDRALAASERLLRSCRAHSRPPPSTESCSVRGSLMHMQRASASIVVCFFLVKSAVAPLDFLMRMSLMLSVIRPTQKGLWQPIVLPPPYLISPQASHLLKFMIASTFFFF